MNKLACPKCHKELIKKDNTFRCDNNHTYDKAARGYINFLLNPDKSTNNPGDSKESLVARKAFLNKGYYDCICNAVINTIKENNLPYHQFLDLGCGEGYYTKKFKDTFPTSTIYGLDISKTAINMATRYSQDIYWLVGNSKNIPILDKSLDLVTALFTVVKDSELKRILKDDSYMIHVSANTNHLIELKHLIYDEIKVKSDKYLKLDLKEITSKNFTQTITINNHEDALNLLKMTPHFYHIKKERRNVLETINNLKLTIDIKITIYQNNQN